MLVILTLLFALATQSVAQNLPNKGTICANNKDCEQRCYHGTYTVTLVNNNVEFTCLEDDPRNKGEYVCAKCKGNDLGRGRADNICVSPLGSKSGFLKCVVPAQKKQNFELWCRESVTSTEKPTFSNVSDFNTAEKSCMS